MACEPPVPIAVFDHSIVADRPYDMDWVEYLAGATLTSVTWVKGGMAAALITLHNDTLENSNTIARVWVQGAGSGMGCGDVYVTAIITTSDGRTDARSWLFHLIEVPA